MKRKINYLVIFLITFICFGIHVSASEFECTYRNETSNIDAIGDYTLEITFGIDLGTSSNKYINPSKYGQNGLAIKRCTSSKLKDKDMISACNSYSDATEIKILYIKNRDLVENDPPNFCPPFGVLVQESTDEYEYIFVLADSEDDFLDNASAYTSEYYKTNNINEPNYERIFYSISNVDTTFKYDSYKESIPETANIEGNIKDESVKKENMINHEISKTAYSALGYLQIGWYVQSGDGEWLCNNECGGEKNCYKSDCSESNRSIIDFGAKVTFPIKTEITYLKAAWELSSAVPPTLINIHKLSDKICRDNGFVWNNYGTHSYCNVDNLRYVMCGDAHDIPLQLPEFTSMAINLLKIATPIILIVVSIITLVKATMASKEDEIKKAQQSLVKKVIAAVMIFMIISIVQFVVTKVADNKDQKSITSCMSCFIDNNCGNAYFKTYVKGTDYCTKIASRSNVKTCNDFYNNK